MKLDETKLLSEYSYELHSLNLKLHQLDIKKSVFVIDDINQHNQDRDNILSEIVDLMEKIGKIYYVIRK